jgi:nitrogen fixation NifU-like protein
MTDDEFVKLLEELQKKIEYEEEQKYSKIVIREYRNPDNFGILDNPDSIAEIKGPCGDTMKIALEIKNSTIIKASFWTDGCGATIACGSILTKMIKDKTLREANEITNLDILEALKGLPIEHHHCTILAINTLQKAIKNYYKCKKSDFFIND